MIKVVKKFGHSEFADGRRKLKVEEFTNFIKKNPRNEFVIITKEYLCCSDEGGFQVDLKHMYYIQVQHYNKKHYAGTRVTFLSGKDTKRLGSSNYNGFQVPCIKGEICNIYEVKYEVKEGEVFNCCDGEYFETKNLIEEFYELSF